VAVFLRWFPQHRSTLVAGADPAVRDLAVAAAARVAEHRDGPALAVVPRATSRRWRLPTP